MKEFLRFSKDEIKPELNESLDRKNRCPRGTLPEDEDELLVNQNDPKYRYKTSNDLVDDSYLSYGEGIDKKMDESEDEDIDNNYDEAQDEDQINLSVSPNNKFIDSNFITDDDENLEEVLVDDTVAEDVDLFTKQNEKRGMGGKINAGEIKTIKNYNLKTEPDNKTQRRMREQIKDYLDKLNN